MQNQALLQAEEQLKKVVDETVEIARVASPPFKEAKRIRFLQQKLNSLGVYSDIDDEGNLVSKLPGKSSGQIVFSAHADTVFAEDTALKIQKKNNSLYGPGVADNSVGLASLIALIRHLKQINYRPRNTLVFLFNVGEEETGNLRGIRHFFDNFKGELFAHICIEGHNLGRITHQMVGSHRASVKVITEGGHSWRDFGKPSAVHVAAQIINHLLHIPLTQNPRSTMNVGSIKGGTTVNAIAEEAEFTFEIRSADSNVLSTLKKQMYSILDKFMREKGVNLQVTLLGDRPSGSLKDTELVNIVKSVHEQLGIKSLEDLGSTDSNYPVSLGLPSLTIGITMAENTHSMKESLEIQPIRQGLAQLFLLCQALDI